MVLLFIVILLSAYDGALASWSVESQPGQDINYFCKGDGYAISGYSITSSLSSSNSNKRVSIKQAVNVRYRVYCVALDGSTSINTTRSISIDGPDSSNTQVRQCDQFSLSDGANPNDPRKNCKTGEYLCGMTVSSGGTRLQNMCCVMSSKYELDKASGCRVIGPIPYNAHGPNEIMNPSQANRGCSVDAATGLGLGEDGIRVKMCSYKKSGQQVSPDCKRKKDQIIKQYVKDRVSSHRNSSSAGSSVSSNYTSHNNESSSSSTHEPSHSQQHSNPPQSSNEQSSTSSPKGSNSREGSSRRQSSNNQTSLNQKHSTHQSSKQKSESSSHKRSSSNKKSSGQKSHSNQHASTGQKSTGKRCSPGLAERGCQPPGQAKKGTGTDEME